MRIAMTESVSYSARAKSWRCLWNLLNNKPGRSRCERVLITAEICRSASFADCGRDFTGSRGSSTHYPGAENLSLPIGHRDHAVRRNLDCARDGLVDDRLDVGQGELRTSLMPG